jgi:hypothetical protein
MPLLAGEVLITARAMLNDPTGAIYADTPMYALMNKAYKELQTKLNAHGISTAKEVGTIVGIIAGTTALTEGSLLPTGLIYPVTLQERREFGTDDDWVDMEETEWEPNLVRSTALRFWTWRNDEINFPGALNNREVKIRYVKSLGIILDQNSPITVINSETWLAQRLAALASLLLGSNPSRASALDNDLNREDGVWDDLKATFIKRKQAIPVRRRRTRYRVL